jgi:hypothetical protein
MEILFTVAAIVFVLAIIGASFYALMFVIGISTSSIKTTDNNSVPADQSMNEGDFHSGPNGYSANTAYPDTFYGSRGSSNDDFDGHDEGDFNR